MVKQSVQGLFHKLGHLIRKEVSIEALRENSYGKYWDRYVSQGFNFVNVKDEHGQQRYEWPGDEWGDREFWDKVFNKLFVKHLPPESQYFVEIGSGSGKQSLLVLEGYRDAKLKCFDVSSEFLNVLKKRCQKHISEGRLEPILMDNSYRFLYDNLKRSQWVGKVDCLFSIDAMVHVDLQYLIVYWVTAAQALRVGGKLIMSVADATAEGGYTKLINDIPVYFPLQGKMSSKFEWLSPDLVQSILGRLGFEITASEDLNSRDFWFVATLIRRKVALK